VLCPRISRRVAKALGGRRGNRIVEGGKPPGNSDASRNVKLGHRGAHHALEFEMVRSSELSAAVNPPT